jgi:adenylate cyclase
LSPGVITYIERSSVIQHEKERLAHETAQREAETAYLLARRRRMATRARMVAFVFLGMWLALYVKFPPAFQPLRALVFDTYQKIWPRQVQALPVVIVHIDEASLTALGQWPWPRTRLARLIDAAHQLGARAIGLDLIMPAADHLSPEVFMEERQYVSSALRHELLQLPANDTLLAATLQRTPVVIGRAGTSDSNASPVPVDDHMRVRTYGEPPLAYVHRYEGHMTNLPQLELAASGHGYLNAEPDQDGVVRLMPLLVTVQEALAPTLVLELLRVAGGQDSYRVRVDDHGIHGIQIGDTLIRTDPDGRLRLHFSQSDPRRYVSALHVLLGIVPAERMQDKIAIIGVTALGIADRVSTPVAARMYGVEIHAQALENILSNIRLVRPQIAVVLEAGVSLLAGLVILFGFPRVRFIWQVVVLLAAAILIGSSSLVAFRHWQLLLDTAFPLLTMAVVYVIASSGGIVELIPSRATRASAQKPTLTDGSM